jgi:hypothetical protein
VVFFNPGGPSGVFVIRETLVAGGIPVTPFSMAFIVFLGLSVGARGFGGLFSVLEESGGQCMALLVEFRRLPGDKKYSWRSCKDSPASVLGIRTFQGSIAVYSVP